jgi:chromosome segregation ATPase
VAASEGGVRLPVGDAWKSTSNFGAEFAISAQLEEKITSVKHADHDNEMTRKVIQKYIKKAEHSKSCPLCNRDFNEDDEEENTAAFIAVLKAQLAEGGEKKGDKVAVDKEIEALIEQKEVMVRARSKFEKARDKRKEIEESGSVIEDLERELELIPVPVQDELDEARGSLKKCEELQKFSQSELSIKKLAELKAAVAQFNAANGGAAAHGGLSKEDVDRQVEQLDAEIERISDERGLAQGTFDMHKAEVHRLHEAVNDARQRVGKLALDEEKLADRRARLLDVDARIGGIVQEFENLRESKAPNEAKLKQTRAELSRVQAEHEKDEKRLGGEQRDLNRDLSSVQSLERDIYQFVSGNKEQALERKRKEKEELEKKLSEAQAKREIAEKEKSQIEAAVEGEMTHLRRLNDVAELIGLKKKIKERQVEMKSARQAIKGLPADDDVVKGFTDITKQREKVRREIDESNGKIESLNTFIKQVDHATRKQSQYILVHFCGPASRFGIEILPGRHARIDSIIEEAHADPTFSDSRFSRSLETTSLRRSMKTWKRSTRCAPSTL